MTEPLSRSRFAIGGMDCASCATKIDTAVRRLPGVNDARVSVAAGTLSVEHAPTADLAALQRQVVRLGYTIAPIAGRPSGPGAAAGQAHEHKHEHGAGCHGDHGHEHSHAHGDDHDHGHGDGGAHRHAETSAGTPAGLHGHDHGPMTGPWWRSPKAQLTIASGLALVAAYAVGLMLPQVQEWAFVVAMLVGLVPIARRALAAAFAGTPFSIEMLMTIAAIGAVIIGAGEEGAAVVFLFLVGELLEGVAASRARASIQSLTTLVPKSVRLEDPSGVTEVPAESVSPGQVIVVRPGDRIGADGVIVEGDSTINEAPVTGESTPVAKGPGASVFAGTINADAVLRVRVTAAAEDNTIARVVRLVEEAQETKAPTERFIDRFSRYYTPGVVAVALLIAIVPPLVLGGAWSDWIYKGLAILLIGCPCALVISTPAAIAAALSAGARRGLLMKGGAVLEDVGKITAIAMDKTGTLTAGAPVVTDIVGIDRTEREVLASAAALEAGSSHPLAIAILARAKADAVAVPQAEGAKAVPGKGLSGTVGGRSLFLGSPKAATERATLGSDAGAALSALIEAGKSVSVLLIDDAVAGFIAMRDEPRPDAVAGVAALKSAGVTPIMLTGDNARTAAAVGEMLGMEVRAELLPEDKQRIVRELQAKGETVGKVGDGINDAPALAAAHVGIAMGGGTDVALETADAAVLHGRVLDLAGMVRLSRDAMRNIHQNIAIALGLKAVFLVTTVLGVTGLWPAILADTGATVLVTANAMRLLAWKPR
ncbi:heavy metal translocating P-type ATPase [Mangrovicella endophytica]|uniref:heavy metal translocating P-type ATPase n=1 Tax=Mangrovicella endophytica TaxID=2066697 RepID=UPI002477E20E|nr:heavy metal translocating P-type ATPase [Mangrovicella endophytica]